MAERIFVFIDGQSIQKANQGLGWRIDLARLFVYLQDKYHPIQTRIFLSSNNTSDSFQRALVTYGYIVSLRPAREASQSKARDCADTELIVTALRDYNRYDRAILITDDGDLYPLIDTLNSSGKLFRLIVPNYYHYANHLTKHAGSKIDYMNGLRQKLEFFPTK